MSSPKIRVGVLFGGASEERAISLASGLMIAEHLPKDRYEVALFDTLALMARNPRVPAELRDRARRLQSGETGAAGTRADLPPAMREQVARAESSALPATRVVQSDAGPAGIDVAFLALHGKFGEDGTVQGFLDLIGVPYTGSGVLASALAMDKVMAKVVLSAAGIPTPRGIHVRRGERFDAAGLRPPLVVKPSKQGSSVGMRMVTRLADLESAVDEALRHDDEALVEQRIVGTEVTVGVIGNDALEALPVVEIVPKNDFFDYGAKYDPAQCEEICPARIPNELAARAQDLAIRSHRALRCAGYSRTDLMLGPDGPVVLEVNTLPGMTMNSLLPKAAAAAGVPFGELLDRIVRLALERPSD